MAAGMLGVHLKQAQHLQVLCQPKIGRGPQEDQDVLHYHWQAEHSCQVWTLFLALLAPEWGPAAVSN